MKKYKRIYVATPVNGRREPTLEEKRRMAEKRCRFLKMILEEDYPGVEVLTSFDVCPLSEKVEEPEAMGRCIGHLLTAEAIYLDHGWNGSKGCNLEYRAARIYGLDVLEYDKL